jgi:hypothetical protein
MTSWPPVSFICWILIMASLGWAEACPKGWRDQGLALSQRGIFRGERVTPTTMRAQAPPNPRRP